MPTRTTLLLLPLLAALATAQIQYENHGNLGPGNDTFQGGDLNDLVHGGGGDDTLKGGGGQDRMYGDDGNDYLFGEGDDDKLSGGDGDDHISGGPGCDEIVGGAGSDTVFDGDWNYSHPCSDGKKDKINLVDGVSGNDHVYAGPEDEITADPGDLVTILMPGTDYTIWHGTFAEWQTLRPTLILINELLQAGHAHGVAPGDLHDVILELERCGVPIEDQYDVWLMMQANDESFAAWLVLAAQVIASCR